MEHIEQLLERELGKAVIENLRHLGSEALLVDDVAHGVLGMFGEFVAADELHDARPIAVVLGQAENNPICRPWSGRRC